MSAILGGFFSGLGAGITDKKDRAERKEDAARADRMLALYEANPALMGGGIGAAAIPSAGAASAQTGGMGAARTTTRVPRQPIPAPAPSPLDPLSGAGIAADTRAALGYPDGSNMTPQEMLTEGARRRGWDPVDVGTAISYETGGTFDPQITGPTTQWGTHEGLIQFGNPQAAQHGARFDTPEEAWNSQLDPETGAVWSYLEAAGVQPGHGLAEIYSAINAGAVGRMGASDSNNGGAPGTVADKVATMAPHRDRAGAFLGTSLTTTAEEDRARIRAQYPAFRNVSDAAIDTALAAQRRTGKPLAIGGLGAAPKTN